MELAEVSTPHYNDSGQPLPKDTGVMRWSSLMEDAMRKNKRPFPSSHRDLTSKQEKAGFEDIQYKMYKQPIGLWPKEKRFKDIGSMALLTCESGMPRCEPGRRSKRVAEMLRQALRHTDCRSLPRSSG